LFGRIYPFIQNAPNIRRGAAVLTVTYQVNTRASGGLLKREARGLNIY